MAVTSLPRPMRAVTPLRISAWAAPTFVWSVWAVLLLAGLVASGTYGNPFPSGEEWTYYIGQLTGAESIGSEWLWKQEGEHRFPLSKIVIMAGLKLTGGDFRAPVLFTVFALGSLACAMIWVARSLRGSTSFADAFFPLVLLHWGISPYLYAHENLYLLPMLIASTVLLIIARQGTHLTLASGLLAGICLLLLPLCSAPGLIYMPALALWLGYCGVLSWRSQELQSKRNALVILTAVLAALLLVALYFLDFEKSYSGPPVRRRNVLQFALAFLTAGFGRDTSWLWPYSGVVMLVLLLLTAGALFAIWRKQLPDRARALGLLFFLGACVTAALAMGWGRGGWGTQIFIYDYLAVPTLCCIFFIWLIYRPRATARLAQATLFAFAVCAFAMNLKEGIAGVAERYHSAVALEEDLRDRVPPYLLILRDGLDATQAPKALRLLRQAGIGSFRYVPDDPIFREIAIPLVPLAVNEATWADGTVYGNGEASYVTFALPRPMFVVGVRMEASSSNEGNADFEFAWRTSGAADFPATAPYSSSWLLGTYYINETIDQIRIYPDRRRPCEFQIAKIVLLLPGEEKR